MTSLRSLLIIVLALKGFGSSTAADRRTPNVVIILADDVGYGDLSCYGATRVKTPNLDRLAAGGMRFVDGHSPSAMCTPTRYALLTGQYAWRHKAATSILSGTAPLCIPADRLTLPKLFKEAGYATGVVGKWHLGLGAGGPTDYNARHRPGPKGGRVRHVLHHPRHRRPGAVRVRRKRARRRARPEGPDPGELPGEGRLGTHGEREPGPTEGEADARPWARRHDRQRHQPHRLDDGRHGGPVEGRGHGRRAHGQGHRVHRSFLHLRKAILLTVTDFGVNHSTAVASQRSRHQQVMQPIRMVSVLIQAFRWAGPTAVGALRCWTPRSEVMQ